MQPGKGTKITIQSEQPESVSGRTFISEQRRKVSAAEGNLLERKQTLLLLCSPSRGGDGIKYSREVWREREEAA